MHDFALERVETRNLRPRNIIQRSSSRDDNICVFIERLSCSDILYYDMPVHLLESLYFHTSHAREITKRTTSSPCHPKYNLRLYEKALHIS